MPRIGPPKSCIVPHVTANSTFQVEAVAVSPPTRCLIRFAQHRDHDPKETAFISAQAKTNRNAAWRPALPGVTVGG